VPPKRSVEDIGFKTPVSFPPPYYVGYLNSRPVQEALGVPRNFSVENMNVKFGVIGYDDPLGGHVEDIGYLLDHEVNVALIYGDRDYSSNCRSSFLSSRVQILKSNKGLEVRQSARPSSSRMRLYSN
jgi:hypothetical protein